MRGREVPGVEGDGVNSPFAEDLVHVRSNSCPSETGDAINCSASLVREGESGWGTHQLRFETPQTRPRTTRPL